MRCFFACLVCFLLSATIASESDPRTKRSEKLQHWRHMKKFAEYDSRATATPQSRASTLSDGQERVNDGSKVDLSKRDEDQGEVDVPTHLYDMHPGLTSEDDPKGVSRFDAAVNTITSQCADLESGERTEVRKGSKVPAADRTDRLTHCGSTWPLRGSWLKQGDVNTWTFEPSACQQHPEQPPNSSSSSSSTTTTTTRVYATLRTCLANRRVIILGNSIGRQFAFELPVLLDLQQRVDRAQQKEQCLKSTGARCVLNVGQNTSVWSAWFLYWDNMHANVTHPPHAQPGGWFKEGWEMDVCGSSSTIDCITGIIGSSVESDVLILVIGISYALWDPVDVSPWDLQSWRQHQVTKFADVMKTIHFKGTVVVITPTPIRSFPDVPFFRDSSSTDRRRGNRYLQERIERYNEHVVPFILQNTNWHIFDAFSMNHPVLYSNLYSDELHFPGRLTALSWRVLIPMLGCNHRINATPPPGSNRD